MSQTKIELACIRSTKPKTANIPKAPEFHKPSEYVIGLEVNEHLTANNRFNICASLQNSNSEVEYLEINLTQNDEDNIKSLLKFANFIEQAREKYNRPPLVSKNPGIAAKLDFYFSKYKIRKPISYISDLEYFSIVDLKSFQKLFNDIHDGCKLESKYANDPSSLKEARITADLYLQTQKLAKQTPAPVDYKQHYKNYIEKKSQHYIESKYPFLFNTQHKMPPKEYLLAFNVETSGSSYTENGLLTIVACVLDSDFNTVATHITHYQLDKSQTFEKTLDPYWKNNSDVLEFIKKEAEPSELAIRRFYKFIIDMEEAYNPKFVCDNPGFQAPWINLYFEKYNVKASSGKTANLYETARGKERYIWDIESEKQMLQILTGECGFAEEAIELKNPEHFSLNKAIQTAREANSMSQIRPALKQSVTQSTLAELKNYQKSIISLLNKYHFSVETTNVIFNYLFVCDDHLHDLQSNSDGLQMLTQIERITDTLIITLDGVNHPKYQLGLGGGSVINKTFDANRFRRDCDFVISDKTQSREHDEALVSFQKTLQKQLSTLRFPLTESAISKMDDISFFTIKLILAIQTPAAFLNPSIELSFIFFPNVSFLPWHRLNIKHYLNTTLKNIFALNIYDILAGKIMAFILADGIFHSSNPVDIVVKNFFDIYMLSFFREVDIGSKTFMEAIKQAIKLNQTMHRKDHPEFYREPLKVMSKVLFTMNLDTNNQFNNESELAQHYYEFRRKAVARCKAHTFMDTVNVLIKIISAALIYLKETFSYEIMFGEAHPPSLRNRNTLWHTKKPMLLSDQNKPSELTTKF